MKRPVPFQASNTHKSEKNARVNGFYFSQSRHNLSVSCDGSVLNFSSRRSCPHVEARDNDQQETGGLIADNERARKVLFIVLQQKYPGSPGMTRSKCLWKAWTCPAHCQIALAPKPCINSKLLRRGAVSGSCSFVSANGLETQQWMLVWLSM